HAGRAEGAEVAQHHRGRCWLWVEAATQPRLGRGEAGLPTLSPHASRWYLDQGEEITSGVRQVTGAASGPVFGQQRAELGVGSRLLLQKRPGDLDEPVEVDVGQRL